LDEPSKLIEARATRVYAGGGTRLKGIYIGGGESGSFQSLKELDSGTLTLTTKRLVFTGSMESRVVNIKEIVSIEPFGADAIVVSTGRKVKRQVYVVRNPIIWSTFIPMLIKGAVWPVTKSADTRADIRFNCPRCGQHLCVEERGAGMAVNCPSCNEQIEIPRSSTALPTPSPFIAR
jgi:DNA-directed RNA polymerase subunit RPC12/RpoP